MYTELYIQKRNRWVSAALAVFALVLTGAAGMVYFSRNPTATRASQQTLASYELANPAPRQMTIIWKTTERQTGWVMYGTDPKTLSEAASDERDTTKNKLSSKLHVVTARNLRPNTKYYYKFVAGNQVIENTDGSPFEFTTPRETTFSGSPKPVYGKVTQRSGSGLANALVLVRKKNSMPVATLTKMSGEWLIPLQGVYDPASREPIQIQDSDELEIQVYDDDLNISKIRAYVSKASPLPQTVVIGTNYEFLKNDDVLPASTKRLESAPVQEIDILFPKQNAIIPGTQPLIKGVAPPRTALELTVDSIPTFSSSTRANARGEWMVNVPKPFQPGTYTLTLVAKNAQNEEVVLSRQFTLTKNGEQVLAAATDAATPTLEPSPTTALEPTGEPTATPEPSLEPTAEVTRTPSATESATITPNPNTLTPAGGGTYVTVTPAPPISGGNGMMYTVVSVGLLVIGAGVMFLL